MEKKLTRLIGKHIGTEPGPLLICFGGIHGNEPAGVRALEIILDMIAVEPLSNPDFEFRGAIYGLRGNLQALEKGVRFLQRDLNRALKLENVNAILSSNHKELTAEDLEVFQLVTAVRGIIEEHDTDRVVILDLHTTTATGGIFTLTSDERTSIEVGIEMHAPVIIGFASMLKGTTMGYFRPANFNNIDITTVVFEGGQHQDPLSVNRTIAAIINCMRTIGCVLAEHVENRHDHLLREYSKGFPKVARLVERYDVKDTSKFEMLPGLKNFDPVEEGQLLAYDHGSPIYASKKSLIIMPKYQEQGDDGFFLVEKATIPSENSSRGAYSSR